MSETTASAFPADRLAVRDDHRGYVIVRERDDGRLAVSFRPGAEGRLVAFAAAPSATALLSETLTEVLGTQRKEHGVSADPASDARWENLKAYLDANVQAARDEASAYAIDGFDDLALRLDHEAQTFALVRQHMGEMEAAG